MRLMGMWQQPQNFHVSFRTEIKHERSFYLKILSNCLRQGCEAHRQTQTLRLDASPALFEDSSKRIMLYCAADPVGGGIRSDIAFPHQLEIKVNNQDVRANFRGLKNKPGSTRPADITSLLNRSQLNYISVTYALTQKRFYIMAVLAKKRTVEELVDRIKRGRVISKQSVLIESKLFRTLIVYSVLTLHSAQQSCRSWHYSNFNCHVSKGSCLCHEDRCTLQVNYLHAQSMLWCCLVPPTSGTGANMDLPDM
jgi:hypothetical protein